MFQWLTNLILPKAPTKTIEQIARSLRQDGHSVVPDDWRSALKWVAEYDRQMKEEQQKHYHRTPGRRRVIH